jgi:iron complex transport system substrate-binding protein
MRKTLLLILLLFQACVQKSNRTEEGNAGAKVKLLYAQGFSITHNEDYTILEVKQPFQGSTSGYKYLLISKTKSIPQDIEGMKIIRTPVQSIVCTSTTHIPMLDYLNVSDRLIGFPTTDFISSEKTRKQIDKGKVVDLGMDKGMNLEKLVSLKPDLLLGYTMTGDYGQFKKIEELKIPVVLNAEYLEKHPLGRAEWIKFVGALFNKEREADSIFQTIERSYLETRNLASQAKQRPKVLCGIMYGDAWFLPGGENYASKIIKDAGCEYLWGDDESNGFLQLSFETVLQRGHNADLWLGVGTISSLEELASTDHKYKMFKPFKERAVYNYDKRKGAKGGNEYLELGYLRPDLILKDLVKISHPELIPDNTLFFYRRLE